MSILISTKSGLINASIEPQFQIGSGTMVTVEFSEYDDVRALRTYLKGDILFDQNAPMFPFTSFILLDDLTHQFKGRKIWSKLGDIKINFSPTPLAYAWVGWHLPDDIDEGQVVVNDVYTGYTLPEEAEDLRWGMVPSLHEMFLYPVYQVSAELAKEGWFVGRQSQGG